MSASAITEDDILEVLGPEWVEQPTTFASVWHTMKIERVWRRLTDIPPDNFVFTLVVPMLASAV